MKESYVFLYVLIPGDLTVSKRLGTSFQIKIYFSIQTTKFLIKYNLVCFQISSRLMISFCYEALALLLSSYLFQCR